MTRPTGIILVKGSFSNHGKLRSDKRIGFALPLKLSDGFEVLDVFLNSQVAELLMGVKLAEFAVKKTTKAGQQELIMVKYRIFFH